MVTKSLAVSFVRYILQQICKNQDEIVIEANEDDRGTLITIKASDEDMGKIIGKGGQTVSAVRTLLSVISAREEKKYFLKVLDSRES